MSAPSSSTSTTGDSILICLVCGDPFSPHGLADGLLPILFSCGHTVCTECAEAAALSLPAYSGKWACGIPACIANPSAAAGDAGCVNAGVVALVQCVDQASAGDQGSDKVPSTKKRKWQSKLSRAPLDLTAVCDEASVALTSALIDVERVNTARESMRRDFESSKSNFISDIDGLLQGIIAHRDRVLGEATRLFDEREKALAAQAEELTVKVSLLRQAVEVCRAAVAGSVEASVDMYESVKRSVTGLTRDPFGGLSVPPVAGVGIDIEAAMKGVEANAYVDRGVSTPDCELGGPGLDTIAWEGGTPNMLRLACRNNRRKVVPDVDARDVVARVVCAQRSGGFLEGQPGDVLATVSVSPAVDTHGVFHAMYSVSDTNVAAVDIDVFVYGRCVARCPVRVYKTMFDGSAVLAGVAPGTLKTFSVAMMSWLPGARKPELLFRMTRDGTKTRDFHSRCDGKGPTVVLILSSNGFVFGGYAGKSWHSEGKYIACDKSFIFTVWNPHGIPPTRYLMNKPACALRGSALCGPAFGGGIAVGGGSGFLTSPCYAPFLDYIDTTGKGAGTFTGAYEFKPAEVEVWRV